MASQRIANNDGVQDALLNSNKSSTPKLSINGLSKKEQTLAENILNNIFQSYITRDTYELNLHSKNIDATLGRIASLLDEVKQSFTSNELESVKQKIITVLNNELNNISNKFDQIGLKNIINGIIVQIELTQTAIINNTKLLLRQFITEQNKQNKEKINNSTQQFIADTVEKISDIQNENTDKITEEIEKNQNDSNKQPAKQNIFNISDINDIINNEISKLQDTVNNVLISIEQNVLDISNKVTQIINIVDNIIDTTNCLVPTSADKKKQKKDIADADKLNKLISNISKQMDAVTDCFKNITEIMINNLELILNSIFNKVVAAWLKIFTTIVLPFVSLVALFLNLLAEPLIKILQPIMDFIAEIVEKITAILEPIVETIVEKLKSIVEITMKNVLVPLFKGLAGTAKMVGILIGKLVLELLNVLIIVMRVIKPVAYAIGQALSFLATLVMKVLILFMQGISGFAYELGVGIGMFITGVLDLLTLLMEGISNVAYELGVAIGEIVLGILGVIDLIIGFFEMTSGILADIMGIIRFFFEGLRSKAKLLGVIVGTVILAFLKGIGSKAYAIGVAVGTFCLSAAKIILAIVKTIQNLSRWTQLYIIAPIKALLLKVDALVMQASDFTISFPYWFDYKINISWDEGVDFHWWLLYKEFKPLSSLTSDWDEARKNRARAAQGKSISELVDEEQSSLRKKFAAEDEAMKLNKARAALDEKNMDLIVDNISMFDDMFALTKSLYEQIYGKENTEKFLNSVKSKFENLDEVKKINEQNAKMKEEISKKLEEKNNFIKQFEKYDQMEEEGMKEQRFLDEFIQFIKTNFEKTMECLENNPSIIALPSNNTNLYNED